MRFNMALYEVLVRSEYFGQQCINRFNYFASEEGLSTPSALELATLMGFVPSGDPLAFPEDTLFWEWCVLVSAEVSFLEVQVRELYSLTDFYTIGYSPVVPGTITGTEAAPFIAYGLRSTRTRADIRRGFKRLVGVIEEYMADGGLVTGTGITQLAAVAAEMGEELVGITANYFPAVLSLEPTVDEDGKVSYKLYETRDEQQDHMATGITWAGYSQVRSQTSRQYGRGS